MKKIEECIGKESLYIRDDFDHLMKSINAKYEEKVRDIMFNKCFKYSVVDANNDRERACTLFQDDIIDLIWQQYDFASLIRSNKKKYVFIYAHIQDTVFKDIVKELENLKTSYLELVEECYNH